MLNIKKTLLLLCVFFLFASCSSKVDYEYTDNRDVYVDELSYKEDGDFLIIFATLKNNSSGDITKTVYRIDWYDEDDNPIASTSWRPILVKGGASEYIRERSTVPGVAKANILISNDSR